MKACLYPGCRSRRGERPSRGLCTSHYFAIRALLRWGIVTEADLVAKGKMLPARVVSKTKRLPDAGFGAWVLQ